MLKTQNFGRKSLNEIKDILNDMGLTFGMKIDSSRILNSCDVSVVSRKKKSSSDQFYSCKKGICYAPW